MSGELKLPVGIESFQEIRQEGFYYIDKTKFIEQLLERWGKVNLFTRPRRFGKTLNMSMLQSFFEIGTEKTLFDGLYISQKKEVCEMYMGKFPVIFISLKNVDGLLFKEAKSRLTELVGIEAERFHFLEESDRLTENDKKRYRALIEVCNGKFTMDEELLSSSLQLLSQLLTKHYGQKTILLIDEYDVPLDKAFQHGYYKEMVSLIRSLFGKVLKTNDFLQFAVLTGCLRVSKESIFTGLNNFKVLSITDVRFDEQFGFTEEEVKAILTAYRLESHLPEMKEWYDGYRFGDEDIYCPWDVINHIDRLRDEPEAEPQAYWINSSGNELVRRFIDKADQTTRDEIEQLVAGQVIEKSIRMDLTYDEIDRSIDNLWSVLFTTGYLTLAEKPQNGIYKLKIPNEEVREVYEYQIKEWFNHTMLRNMNGLRSFWNALADGNAKEVEGRLTKILSQTISIYDLKKTEAESSYHTFLLGLLAGNGTWGVVSNREGGDGRPDIIVKTEDPDAGIVIELKKADTMSEMEEKCKKAIGQIHERRYDEYLRNEGRHDIWAYGIAFYKKRCRVEAEKL